MNHSESGEVTSDRRTQARIEVRIPVKVTFPGEEVSITGVNEDISWGGALLRISGPLPKVAGNIRLVYPWKQGDSITIEGRMLRATPLDDGRHYEVAVRFVSLSPRSQSRLVKLLKLLRNGRQSTERADTSDLVRELEVEVNDADNLRSMLKQIAKGHHSLTVFDAYEPNQSISLSIVGTRDLPSVRLRARVIHVQKSNPKGFEWAELYTLLLEFEHPIKALRASVKMLLQQLPAARESSQASEAAPDWLRATPFAHPTVADRTRFSLQSNALSVLEADFPEALNRLMVGWGDVEMFESLFRDLTLGDHGLPGGWPPDAWAELEMLQDVHDLSYGTSAERRSPLKGGRTT